jgi:hypothetical protein
MSTRSHIGVRNTNGTVDYIYCHFDGYPEHNGKILTENYQDMDRVNALIKLGDLSSLDKEIGEKHSFDNRVRGWCHAYGRDREEYSGTHATTSTFEDLLANDNVDYLYVYEDEFWNCYKTTTKKQINLLHFLDTFLINQTKF